VTTIIGGHCGSSLAPLIYGSLESIRKWADINQVNVNWHSIAEFLRVLPEHKIGVNFGTLVGHSTIRRALIGEALRDLTLSEIEVFKGVLRQSLDEGALGFSTGLGYAHSRRVPYSEIEALAKVVAEKGGVYATHLRDEREGLLASVTETIKIAAETGVGAIISHLKPILGFEHEYRKAVELISQLPEFINLNYDNYPFDESVVPVYTLLPTWAQIGNLEVMLSYIEMMLQGFEFEENGEPIRLKNQ
jgi:N-acyl-D-amino-acid deacylase